MNIAYVRTNNVPSHSGEIGQINALESYNIEKWFVEKASGVNINRPILHDMLNTIQCGDTVYITDFNRLARNTSDFVFIAKSIIDKGANIVSVKEDFDASTVSGKLTIATFDSIK